MLACTYSRQEHEVLAKPSTFLVGSQFGSGQRTGGDKRTGTTALPGWARRG